MTGPEHYKEAERLAERGEHYYWGDGADTQVGLAFLAHAQVHATLALAAATGLAYVPMPEAIQLGGRWTDVIRQAASDG